MNLDEQEEQAERPLSDTERAEREARKAELRRRAANRHRMRYGGSMRWSGDGAA